MAQNKRILFIAGEVAPFAQVSDMADLVRTLPEQLQNSGDYETRITLPRYGTINERRNRLHEVIRLSGTEITMGNDVETLTVKVASIPDIRLQVYFMDHDKYFGRKAIAVDENGNAFDDNADRALFYTRSVLETIRKLRWGPDVIHGFGWAAGLVPLLMHTEYAADDVLSSAKVVFTPDAVDGETSLTEDFLDSMNIRTSDNLDGLSLTDLGSSYADAIIYPHFMASSPDAHHFDDEAGTRIDQLVSLYDEMLSEVPA